MPCPPALLDVELVHVGGEPSARRAHLHAPCQPDGQVIDVGAERERARIVQEAVGLVEGVGECGRRTGEHRREECHQVVGVPGDELSDLHPDQCGRCTRPTRTTGEE